MTLNLRTEIKKLNNNKQPNKQSMDKIVRDTFDELVAEILAESSSNANLHPSEEQNRDFSLMKQSTSKVYDFINSYHAFCKLCEQHLYSRSIAGDINSFFQKHLNTSYHRQMRMAEPPPKGVPIITWEEKLYLGRCNVCNISGLNSYILDTSLNPKKLTNLHPCIWNQTNWDISEKFLRKFHLIRKYCGLKIFREKYIKTLDGKGVCMLCGYSLPWSGEKAKFHLTSERHFLNFCRLIENFFNLSKIELLNGFNLEKITRWMATNEPPSETKFISIEERELCLHKSNDVESPYGDEQDNFSCSSEQVRKLLENEETDFFHRDECLLCNVPFGSDHASSNFHKANAAKIGRSSFATKDKYLIYCRNRHKRLHIVQNFTKLAGPDPPQFYAPPKQATSYQVNYFKRLFKQKLTLVSYVFTVVNSQEVFCEICDQYIPISLRIAHLDSACHISQENSWDELEANFENEKFMEPFKKIEEDLIVCLLCGAFFGLNCFFSHLKGILHTRKFEWYCTLDISLPISSAFVFLKNLSCYCVICKCSMDENLPHLSLKLILTNVRQHWPCPNANKNAGNLAFELKTSEEEENKECNRGEDASAFLLAVDKTIKQANPESPKNSCAKEKVPKVNFVALGQILENIVKVFEKEMINYVIIKSTDLISSRDDSKLVAMKEALSKNLSSEERLAVPKDSPLGCGQSSTSSQNTGKSGKCSEKDKAQENFEMVVKNKLEAQKSQINIINLSEISEKDRNSIKDGDKVLVIKGLQEKKEKIEIIFSEFSFGEKIRYFLHKDQVVVVFSEPNLAKVAASKFAPFAKTHKLLFNISTWKAVWNSQEKRASLNKSVVHWLKNTQALMELAFNLITQAVRATESPEERFRENTVCSTILTAIYESFPKGRCYVFGSRASGLTLNSSDLDVFFDSGGKYGGLLNTSPAAERRLVNKVAGLLRKVPQIKDINVVARARVPIVSFYHQPTRMRCDLSFKNGLSIQNTLLIKFMVSLDWRVRPLVLLLKHWAKINKLHGPPYFSSYAIAMMVIYYLEQLERPLLPTIESLQSSYVGHRITIAGWDCSVDVSVPIFQTLRNNDPLPQLLAGLFEFYANFDYKRNVISPLTGKPLSRRAFTGQGISELPLCYKRQILNLPMPLESLVSEKIFICIIDPFDLSHVLTKAFTLSGLQSFIDLCRLSRNHLKNAMEVVIPLQ